jgi:hypothetical protein
VQPLAERPVADLVVVLQADDEGARGQAGRVAAARALQVLGVLAAEEPALPNGGRQVGDGAGEVAVVALVVAGQHAPHLVVEVVGPDAVEAPAALGLRAHHVGQVAVVLGDQVHGPPRERFADPGGQLGEDVAAALVVDGVGGVQAHPVEVVLVQPVEGVLDEEVAYRGALVAVEVHRLAPGGAVPPRPVVRAEGAGVVAVGAEVVVDHVEQHRQAVAVGGVHQAAQVVGPAVAAGRGERADAVVAPVPPPGEVAQRHQLDGVDPQVGQLGQLLLDAGERAGGAEGADVQLVDDKVLARHVAPAGVGPGERARVDDLGRTVDAVGLGARGRVGEGAAALEAVAVAVAGPDAGDEPAVIAARRALQRVAVAAAGGSLQDHLDGAELRGPDAEPGALALGPGSQGRLPGHCFLPFSVTGQRFRNGKRPRAPGGETFPRAAQQGRPR